MRLVNSAQSKRTPSTRPWSRPMRGHFHRDGRAPARAEVGEQALQHDRIRAWCSRARHRKRAQENRCPACRSPRSCRPARRAACAIHWEQEVLPLVPVTPADPHALRTVAVERARCKPAGACRSRRRRWARARPSARVPGEARRFPTTHRRGAARDRLRDDGAARRAPRPARRRNAAPGAARAAVGGQAFERASLRAASSARRRRAIRCSPSLPRALARHLDRRRAARRRATPSRRSAPCITWENTGAATCAAVVLAGRGLVHHHRDHEARIATPARSRRTRRRTCRAA